MAMDGSNPEDLAVGCLLSVKTTLGDEFEAQVIAFDRSSNVLVLQEGFKPGARRNIRLLKANYIKDFTFLGQAEDPLNPSNCYLDLSALRAREEVAVRYFLSCLDSERIQRLLFSVLFFIIVVTALFMKIIWVPKMILILDKQRLRLRKSV